MPILYRSLNLYSTVPLTEPAGNQKNMLLIPDPG